MQFEKKNYPFWAPNNQTVKQRHSNPGQYSADDPSNLSNSAHEIVLESHEIVIILLKINNISISINYYLF